MPVVRHTESRRTETPNAIMTTLASPTQGGAGQAVWRVDMVAEAAGPVHTFDVEQIWTFLEGSATVDLDGEEHEVAAGDTVVMPAGVVRQIRSAGFAAIVAAPAGARVLVPGHPLDETVPAWIA